MADKTVAKTTKSQNSSLPPIGVLFSDSWELFTLSWKKLLIFTLVMIGLVIVFVVAVLIILAITIGGGVVALIHGHYSPAAFGTLGIGVIFGVIAAVAAVITLNSINQAGSILVVNSPTTSIEELLRKSFKLVLPLFALSLITFILAVPAFFLFIIPGLLVVLFLYFAPYSLVLSGRGVLDSLRRSIYLVKNNFLGILGRALLMIALFIGVSFLLGLGSFIGVKVPLIGILLTLARIIINIGLGWFIIAYSLTLYKQAEAASIDKEGKGKILWFALFAVVSVVLFSLLIGTIVKSVISNPEIKSAIVNSAVKSNSQSLGSGDMMKATYKNAFLSACGNGGNADEKKLCSCIADDLTTKYSAQELQDIVKKYAATKQTPKEFMQAAKDCITPTQ